MVLLEVPNRRLESSIQTHKGLGHLLFSYVLVYTQKHISVIM